MENETEKPVLRVGIISDVQAYPYSQDWGMHNCEKALWMLAEKNIDVLVNAGDISDHGNDNLTLKFYRRKIEEFFAGKVPELVTCAGNHDFWNNPEIRDVPQEQIFREFCEALGDPVEDPCRKTIRGYDFIAFSSDNKRDYSEADCEKLRPLLDDAVARDPEKPVFVVTHYQPSDTCAGSLGASGRGGLKKVFDDYPQVVSLSGHTHCPLEDERCIWQGAFTALNTSTLSYGCVQDRCTNVIGSILPFAREAVQMMYLEIFPDRLEFHRYNVEDGREIKPDRVWTVAVPYKPENAVYTAARASSRKAPEFKPGTQIYFRIDYGFVYLVFDGAGHDDFVHFYKIRATELRPDGTEAEPMEWRMISNFYRLRRNQDPRMIFKFPKNTLEKAKKYRFEVFPVETFGNMGSPITLVTSVPPTYTFQNADEIGPQE